jgi:hypothetical protein
LPMKPVMPASAAEPRIAAPMPKSAITPPG